MTFLICFDKCSADCSDSLKHFFLFLFLLFDSWSQNFVSNYKVSLRHCHELYIYIRQFDVTITVLVLLTAIKRPSITITSITISITNTS